MEILIGRAPRPYHQSNSASTRPLDPFSRRRPGPGGDPLRQHIHQSPVDGGEISEPRLPGDWEDLLERERIAVAALRVGASRVSPPIVPDLVTPIIGWRSWLFAVPTLADLSLSGAFSEEPWLPGRALVASCTIGWPKRPHVSSPTLDCRCGIYAVKPSDPPEDFSRGFAACMPIFGEVDLWGKVIESEQGYRAQFAYPRRLVVLEHVHLTLAEGRKQWHLDADAIAALLGARYGVPASVAAREQLSAFIAQRPRPTVDS